ncbi:MAG: hypothetical protein J5984_05820 [Clostridia bacterium]|nr:hypothetical protein [Clostridia bacterium]MBO5505978.1 hypothetical protein [Clostridia bacterium]
MRCRPNCSRNKPLGWFFVALGLGILLAHVIPYYLLLAFFGIALICVGINFITRK